MDDKEMKNVERCVTCGEIIPEGRQVCPNCESAVETDYKYEYLKTLAGLDKSEALVNILRKELKKELREHQAYVVKSAKEIEQLKKRNQDASKAVLQAFDKLKHKLYGKVVIRAVNDETNEDMISDEVFGIIEQLEKEYKWDNTED